MADTRVQNECEEWIRREWMPGRFGQRFHKRQVRLIPGGVFEFDAVSEDGSIVATISTSRMKTVGGRYGSGKMTKIRADMYFLLLAEDAQKRVIILTERDMALQCQSEASLGRIPASIEILHVALPEELSCRLEIARQKAAIEVSPHTEDTLDKLQQQSK